MCSWATGAPRAFVNDQPVSVQVLKSLGALLVEIHGQHDDRALVDMATHRGLLDAYGGLEGEAAGIEALWDDRRNAQQAVAAHRAEVERALREADWLRHAADELKKLAPQEGEETTLAERRAAMMGAEKVAEDLRAVHDTIAGSVSPTPALAAAIRRLERRNAQAPGLVEPVVKAVDSAITSLEEARLHLEQALRMADHDPGELERIEERLFALRAAARKYNVPVDGLAALAEKFVADLELIDAGAERLKQLEAAALAAEQRYGAAAKKLSNARKKAADTLDKAVNKELAPLKLERAHFSTQLSSDTDQRRPARHRPRGILGADQSRHQARAVDEGGFRRRAGALPAGVEGGAGRSRLGADARI